MEDLKQVTAEIQNSKKLSVNTKPAQSQSPTDHLLENVSKMMETSTKDIKDKSRVKGEFPNFLKKSFKILCNMI